MRNVTKDNITDVFKAYMGPDMEPRMREVMSALVQHMHAQLRGEFPNLFLPLLHVRVVDDHERELQVGPPIRWRVRSEALIEDGRGLLLARGGGGSGGGRGRLLLAR